MLQRTKNVDKNIEKGSGRKKTELEVRIPAAHVEAGITNIRKGHHMTPSPGTSSQPLKMQRKIFESPPRPLNAFTQSWPRSQLVPCLPSMRRERLSRVSNLSFSTFKMSRCDSDMHLFTARSQRKDISVLTFIEFIDKMDNLKVHVGESAMEMEDTQHDI